MDASCSSQWQVLYREKCHDFFEERCYGASTIKGHEALQASIRGFSKKYKVPNLPDIIRAFEPSLSNLKPFSLVVHSVSQDENISNLLWGGIYAVVEVGTPFGY